MTELFFYVHPWVFGLVFVVCILAVLELGYRLGRKSSASSEQKTNVHSVEAAILLILALLLGFTMSMAVSRFEDRRHLILEEANAIHTSHLRAQLLPAPEGPEIAGLLREYVESRLVYFRAGVQRQNVQAARAETAKLEKSIWLRVDSLSQKDNRSLPAGLLVQSLNQAFDLENAGWTALISHVPGSVVLLNVALSLLTAMFVGYSFGLSHHRQFFSGCLLAISISIVLITIVDLDQPRGGFVRVSRQPMIDLQKELSTTDH